MPVESEHNTEIAPASNRELTERAEKGERDRERDRIFPPKAWIQADSRVKGLEEYASLYKHSLENNEQFWTEVANKNLAWNAPFTQVTSGDLAYGDVAWFLNGKLNVCYNAVDRHAALTPNRVAIYWEGDEGESKVITYQELLRNVCITANALKFAGVRKGDAVCIYMPMVPEAVYAMLACVRIGAVHSVVFAGYSADALRDRIRDAQCKVLFTANEGCRGGKRIPLKLTADRALKECDCVRTVFVLRRTEADVPMRSGRDVWWDEEAPKHRPVCPCEVVDSEDTMFILYTSGSTAAPKGVAHTSGGYAVYASLTFQLVFDYRAGDVFACVADIGWITGHTYVVYGPLLSGANTMLFESTPLYPNPGRYWQTIEKYHVNIFYTAPTALRALMRYPNSYPDAYNMNSLRVLGSVGEPINDAAWRWYHDVVGRGRCAIVDTYWQTETGGIVIAPLPGATPLKPGSASLPLPGIELCLLDESGREIEGNGVSGLLAIKRPWPGMARTVHGNHARYMRTYLEYSRGKYLTGDGCTRDKDGYYWITGRTDDIMKVSGHLIGTADVETALAAHSAIAEAAVVGVPHPIKGQSIFAFCIPKEGVELSSDFIVELKLTVRNTIGALAIPDDVLLVPALPKTRSGKIMRRLLKKIAEQNTDNMGDCSALADPGVIDQLRLQVQAFFAERSVDRKRHVSHLMSPLLPFDMAQPTDSASTSTASAPLSSLFRSRSSSPRRPSHSFSSSSSSSSLSSSTPSSPVDSKRRKLSDPVHYSSATPHPSC